jgi:O-antigen/teichoic acid export membrane protein
MNEVRIAVLLMTAQRYLGMVLSFFTVAVVSRLLRPDEIGVAVIGSLIANLAISLREFAATNYLVQKRELTQNDIRAAISVMMLVSCAVTAGLWAAAPWIAWAYDKQVLVPYLRVVAIGTFLDIAFAPVIALMQRNIAFDKVAMVLTLQIVVSTIVTIGLAAAGFSSMSFAWAWLISAAFAGGLALCLWRDLSIFIPIASGWRAMLTFGGYNGVNQFLARIYESVPSLILGRLVAVDAVGLYSRAITICQLPDKVFLSGVTAVALPAFSAKTREASPLKEPYLRGVSYITALQWPALAVIAILAHPIVDILLGSQWEQTVPLVQIISMALLFSFTFELNTPVLVAMGTIRDVFLRAVIAWPISAVILSIGAYFGLKAMAFSMLLAVPFQAYVAIHAVRKHIEMTWGEILLALRKSFFVTLITAAGPLAMVALAGFTFDLSVIEGIAAGLLAAPCWLVGLWITKHPFISELLHLLAALKQTPMGRKLTARFAG